MASPAAEAPPAPGGEGVDATSSMSNTPDGPGPKPQKKSLKRSAKDPPKAKAKKQAKTRHVQPDYHVHQGEDMLLVISSSTSQYHNGGSAWTPPKKARKKIKIKKKKMKKKVVVAKGKVKVVPLRPISEEKEDTGNVSVQQEATDHRWGQSLPEEVLISIFQMVVDQDGAVPFLCRAGRVCRLWNTAASSPFLWRKVTIAHCWIASRKKIKSEQEKKIRNTVNWLAENRFSQLRDFSLCHWKNNVSFAVEVVSQFCPHLDSLKVSNCTGLTAEAFHSVGLHSRSLHSINLQDSEFQVEGVLEYLENHGSQIKQMLWTHGVQNSRLLAAITRGCCPDLELLEINTKLDSKNGELTVHIHSLQMACPKLKTFRMLNITPRLKLRIGADSTLGFPLLEELCIATTSFSYTTDKDLWDILFGSTGLRVLDVRGCSRITPAGLAKLPCLELECLFWGQYFNSNLGLSSLKRGLHTLTQKWSRTLQQLDIANQLFAEDDLETAMSHLAQATETDTLRSLNLSGTIITPPALRSLIGHVTALSYLNLSSCRYLPRGAKRIYRGQEDISQLLDKLE